MTRIGDFSASATLKVPTNTGRIQIIKKDAETSTPIENVTFQLLTQEGVEVATATTNSQGIANFSNLYQGNYVLKEIGTNSNYILNETPFNITVEYDKITTKEITNERKKGTLKVYKVDKDNHKIPLGNVTFDLFSKEFDRVIGTYTTDVNRRIYSFRLESWKLLFN